MAKQAGSKQVPVMFLLQDAQIQHESNLEEINTIISNSDVECILNAEDQDEVL